MLVSNKLKDLLFLFISTFQFFQILAISRTIPVKDPDNILLTFGSCNRFQGNHLDNIFYPIADIKSDLWIWLGDAAYLDLRIRPLTFVYAGEKIIKERFQAVKNSPAYVHLRNSTEIIGVWDNHDYGLNNAGKNFPHKDMTQQLWLDFIDEPKESPRRKQKGIYESYYIGDSSKIKVILLDVRYFKEETSKWKPKGTDLLGEEQWRWLEEELKGNTAEYVLIGSGIQVLPDDRIIPEHWYAENRDRLIGLIRKYKVSGVVLLSGDVHFAEVMRYPCKEHIGYELYEFTSSGLTHSVNNHVPYAEECLDAVFPETWSKRSERYIGLNFGVLRFSFGKEGEVKYEVRDSESRIVMEKKVKKEDLVYDEGIVDENKECREIQRGKYGRFFGHFGKGLVQGKWAAYAILGILLLLVLIVVGLIVLVVKLIIWVARKLLRLGGIVGDSGKIDKRGKVKTT